MPGTAEQDASEEIHSCLAAGWRETLSAVQLSGQTRGRFWEERTSRIFYCSLLITYQITSFFSVWLLFFFLVFEKQSDFETWSWSVPGITVPGIAEPNVTPVERSCTSRSLFPQCSPDFTSSVTWSWTNVNSLLIKNILSRYSNKTFFFF